MLDEMTEILLRQYEQQDAIWGPLPEDRDAQRVLAERLSTRLMGEVYQYLDAIKYNALFHTNEAPRSTRVLEIVDILKYTLALAWTEGVTARELVDAFDAKTRTVEQRYNQSMLTSKVCGFDIDGVLAEYGAWLPDEATFIENGGVLKLTPAPGAVQLLRQLKAAGWSIIIVTARKAHIYRRLERDTHDWLQMHQFVYDRVLFGYDKMELVKQYGAEFRFFVEDSPKHALDLANGNIRVFHINGGQPLNHRNITTVRSIADVRGVHKE